MYQYINRSGDNTVGHNGNETVSICGIAAG